MDSKTREILAEAYGQISILSEKYKSLKEANNRMSDKLDAYESVLKAVNHNIPEQTVSSPTINLTWQAEKVGAKILDAIENAKQYDPQPAQRSSTL